MPFIERFHPNLEQDVEEEYVETEDKEAAETGSGEANNENQNIRNDTRQYANEAVEGKLKFMQYTKSGKI